MSSSKPSGSPHPYQRQRKPIATRLGWSDPSTIRIYGHNITDILGNFSLTDMAHLSVTGRLPKDANERRMFDACCVTLVEHGMTPSAIAARMTYIGAPEAMQAAVAAGLSGLGSVFVGSTETSAKMVTEALPFADAEKIREGKLQVDLKALAKKVVAEFRAEKKIIPGIGHPLHKPIDPRTPRLFQLAKETGFSGPYVQLMQEISKAAEEASGKQMPCNATGALGAILSEMGIPWKVCRGIGVLARAVGLIGHIREESERPMMNEVWFRIEDDASEDQKREYYGDEKPKSKL
ncbi:citrate synthase [Hyaloraphidium curvatum]|nr:citrate synthase [Hyaloraphidium curvatum]